MRFETKEFAACLLRARQRDGLSIEAHASALNDAGVAVSMSALHRYETAQTRPRITFFLAVCKHYQLDPFQFVSLEEVGA